MVPATARRPKARLSMPSTVVDDLWHEMLLHTRDYAVFCDAAFGRFLHHEPESTMTPDQGAANRSDRLLLTLRLARRDENCDPGVLPLLFRVDQEVGLKAPYSLQRCHRAVTRTAQSTAAGVQLYTRAARLTSWL